jgi:hypothetical protein
MANAVITVLEADGTTETDVTVLDVGRQAAEASKSVAASTEDKAVLDAIAASASVMDDWDRTDACKVVGTTVVKSVTLTTDTSAYANGDVIADTQQVDAAFRIADGTGVLQAISVFDADDQTPYSFTIYLHRTSTSIGTENGGITISDANAAAGIIGAVAFTPGDCFDLINGRMYFRSGLGIPVSAVSGTDDLYISMVGVVGTPTHTASGITVLLHILQD